MAIYQIDINDDRINYIVHLDGETEDELFWIVPMEDDGSDKWITVQAWLDEGNVITDTIEYLTLYKGARAREYPDIGDQLDTLWHAIDENALDKTSDFYTTIKAVKDANPKP